MKKKILAMLLVSIMALSLLAACGPADNSSGSDDAFSANLEEFYGTLFQGDDAPFLMVVEDDDMLEGLYPGLKDIDCKQRVVATPVMSAVAAEVALVEVANASDVDAVKDILQGRIDSQVAGGAWYPETIEQWEQNSEIVVRGNYVCLFVGQDKDEMVASFKGLK